MNILCPECKAASSYDETFCGSKGTVIKCGRCGIFFKIFNRDRIDAIEPPEWLLRKSNGTILKVEFLSSIQKWIFDGTAIKTDELLRGSGGWVSLGNVPELDGLFQLALIGRDERTAKMWKMPTVNIETAKNPPPQAEKKMIDKVAQRLAGIQGRPDDEITLTVPGRVLEEKIRLAASSELPPDPGRKETSASDDVEPVTSPVDLTKKSASGTHEKAKAEEKLAELTDLVVDVSGEVSAEEEASPEALALEEHSVEIPLEGFAGDEGDLGTATSLRPRGRKTKVTVAVCLTALLSLAVIGWLFREPLADWAGSIFKPGVSEGLKNYAPKTEKEPASPDEKQDTQGPLLAPPPSDASQAGEVDEQEITALEEEPQEPGESPGGEPKDFESNYKRAIALQKAHNCTKAVDYFRKAIAQNVKDTETWTGLAECYNSLAQYNNAVNAYKTALSFNSRYEPALIGLADTFKNQGSHKAASDAYSRYLDMYPFGPHADRANKNLDELKSKETSSDNPYEETDDSSKSKSKSDIPKNPYE